MIIDFIRTRKNIILITIGGLLIIGLFVLFSFWHPFWRFQAGYVSEAQFGIDWPFTVSEAKVVCIGNASMLLETSAGIFGMTSNTIRIGYTSLEEAPIWKWDPNASNHRVPAESFWLYVNSLCR